LGEEELEAKPGTAKEILKEEEKTEEKIK